MAHIVRVIVVRNVTFHIILKIIKLLQYVTGLLFGYLEFTKYTINICLYLDLRIIFIRKIFVCVLTVYTLQLVFVEYDKRKHKPVS